MFRKPEEAEQAKNDGCWVRGAPSAEKQQIRTERASKMNRYSARVERSLDLQETVREDTGERSSNGVASLWVQCKPGRSRLVSMTHVEDCDSEREVISDIASRQVYAAQG